MNHNSKWLANLLKTIQQTPGAISITEAVGLYQTIMQEKVPLMGEAFDFGSNAGKSSIPAYAALHEVGIISKFYMVDPIFDLKNEIAWRDTVQKTVDKMPWGYARVPGFCEKVRQKVQFFGSDTASPILIGDTSINFMKKKPTKLSYPFVSYAFIDSDDHQEKLVREEMILLDPMIMKGGLIFFHDFKNQYVGPYTVYLEYVNEGKYEPINIDWEMARQIAELYEKENDSWHMPGVKYPNFLGCMKKL